MTFCQAKYLVLVLLVVQNTCLVLLMRYSRTRPGTMYLGSTAVCCDEFMKLVTCLGILTVGYILKNRKGESGGEYSQLSTGETAKVVGDDDDEFDEFDVDADEDVNVMTEGNNNTGSFGEYLSKELQFDFRVAGVAGIYTVQKNLLYLAISNLDAAVFQVTYQAKILTTAIFSCILLGRKLGWLKIAGLVILTMGVAIVQLDKVEENASKSYQEQHQLVGVLAVLGACCTSGFAGVYFELVLKPRKSAAGAVEGPGRTTGGGDGEGLGRGVSPRPPPSVWAKNVQLSAFALAIALAAVCIKDHNTVLEGGFFQGYSPLVWTVISFEALGGLVTAAVIKYADNILKSFATAVSIVTSTIVSACVFGFVISKMFVIGCLLVFVAIGLYSRKDKTADGPAPSTTSSQTPWAQKKGSDILMVQINSRSGMPSANKDDGLRIKYEGS